jgi:cellulose synthase/poly-beta-1,6-N-acetylglucosamine synthase-like glycosyltransferase
MDVAEMIFLAVYCLILLGLCFYGAHRYHMAWLYLRHRSDRPVMPEGEEFLPRVTIQLPIFNERYVIERLVDYVCEIRYPKDLLEIQVLDDSTDDTTEFARRAVSRAKSLGMDIKYIHRTDRTGFKAGALEAGMKVATGEFIAVFDADFTPTPDFLEKTVPYFADEEIGMVQARWDHINRNFSLLTQAQSILLDGHFVIEHTARNRSGRFFNFNGTAGIWRKSCVEDAGGWEHDTLTEDLDLSYRAQLKGWRFTFLNDLLAPAEVPIEMNAFKTQQHRWAKGSIQVGLKMLPTILRSDQPSKVKMEAFIHLTNNLAYVLMLILSLMMPFALRIRVDHGMYETLLLDLPFFVGATISVCTFYILSQREAGGNWVQRILCIPFVLALGIGLAVNNAVATFEALFGHESPFVRTPKLAVEGKSASAVKTTKYRGGRNLLPIVELFFAAVYTHTLLYCIESSLWFALPFMLLFQLGFLYTGLMSLFQWTALRRRLTEAHASTA